MDVSTLRPFSATPRSVPGICPQLARFNHKGKGGTGLWVTYCKFIVESGKPEEHTSPAAYSANRIQAVADGETTALVTFVYE